MAEHHGPELDDSRLYDDSVLERELQEALGSNDREVHLFKVINKMLRVKRDLQSETTKIMLTGMWGNVADFFDAVVGADTLIGLAPDDKLVTLHQRMKANFSVVSDVNAVFGEAREAESELRSADDMDNEIEEQT